MPNQNEDREWAMKTAQAITYRINFAGADINTQLPPAALDAVAAELLRARAQGRQDCFRSDQKAWPEPLEALADRIEKGE